MNTELPTVAVVTGGGGTIGRAVGKRLLDSHDTVVLVDRNDAHLQDAADGIGKSVVAHIADLTIRKDTEAAFETAARHGRITTLVNAVGTTTGTSLLDLDDDTWSECIASCLTSVFTSLRAAVRQMQNSGGAICTLGSPHAQQPNPGFPAYAAAKAGVAALARQIAVEYGQLGIRSNIVTPGWTTAPHTMARVDADKLTAIKDATPSPRLGEAEDVAYAVAFLVSHAARHINGAELVVDGGATNVPPTSLLRASHRRLMGLDEYP